MTKFKPNLWVVPVDACVVEPPDHAAAISDEYPYITDSDKVLLCMCVIDGISGPTYPVYTEDEVLAGRADDGSLPRFEWNPQKGLTEVSDPTPGISCRTHIGIRIPDICIYKRDITSYINSPVVSDGVRVFETYWIDRNREIHLCELTPSYELNLIDHQWHHKDAYEFTDTKIDQLHDLMATLTSESDRYMYFHVRDVDRNLVNEIPKGGFPNGMCGGYTLFTDADVRSMHEWYENYNSIDIGICEHRCNNEL